MHFLLSTQIMQSSSDFINRNICSIRKNEKAITLWDMINRVGKCLTMYLLPIKFRSLVLKLVDINNSVLAAYKNHIFCLGNENSCY